MAIGGIFSGQAATAFNDSLLRWEQLQQQEEAAKRQAELQERQLEIQEAQNKWQQERAKYLDAFNMGVHDDEMDAQFIRTTFENWDQMTPDGKAQAIEQFQELGQDNRIFNRYAGTLTSMFSRGITVNPDEGMAILTEMQRAEPGSMPYPKWMVELAAEAVANGLPNMSDEDRQNFIDSNLAFADSLLSDNEEARASALEAANLENQKAQAQIDDLNAGTALKGAQTAATTQNTEFLAEQAPLVLDQLRLQNEGQSLANFEQNFRNGTLDREWELRQNDMLATIAGKENANELFDATFEDQVDAFAAQTDLTQAEARVAVATVNARIMVEQGQWDLLRAQVRNLNQQTETDAAREELITGQAGLIPLQEMEMRSGILVELVQAGQADLIGELAPQLLADTVSSEDMPGLISSLQEIAGTNLENAQKEAAGRAVAAQYQGEYWEASWQDQANLDAAQADQAEFTVDHMAEELERQRDLDERGMRVQERNAAVNEGQLVLDRDRLNAQINQWEASSAAQAIGPATDLTAMLDDIQNATSWDSAKISATRDEIAGLEAERAQLLSMANSGASIGASALGQKYGIMDAEGALRVAANLQGLIETRKENIVTGIYQIFSLAAAKGHVLTAADIGLAGNDPYFERALARAGIYSADTIMDAEGNPVADVVPLSDAVLESQPQILSAIDDWLVTNPDQLGSALTGGAVGLHTHLQQEFGQGVLDALGLRTPSDVMAYIEPIQQERNTATQSAALAVQHYGGSLSDIDGRQSLVVQTQDDINRLIDLRHQITNLDTAVETTPQGRPTIAGARNAPAVQAQVGPAIDSYVAQVEELLPPGVDFGWNLFGQSKGSLLEVIDQAINQLGTMQTGVIYFNLHRPPQ